MKKFILSLIILLGIGSSFITSCDKVKNPYPPKLELDTTLIEGTWAEYLVNYWPNFEVLPNDNVNRNALIEDFTGHRCPNCPNAADVAHDIHATNPSRIFIASIHSSAVGMSNFQQEDAGAGYPTILYNDNAFEIGTFFGSYAEAQFFANPQGAINRVYENNMIFTSFNEWESRTENVLNSESKVNIKAKVNYFESKRGLYLHTEIENINNAISNQLGLVTYLLEDSIVAAQTMPDNTKDVNYVHRDVFRGTLDNLAFGQLLTSSMLTNGKYYVNYSYKLPEVYNPENMHLLIYVYDKVTYEIYQVIKKDLL